MIEGVLFEAVRCGRLEDVRALVESGADVGAAYEDPGTNPLLHGKTLLHLAAQNNRVDVARFLIESGADVRAVNKRGHTPLHLAAWNGHEIIVRFLVEAGADVQAADDDSWTPLHDAIRNGYDGVVRVLLHAGADRFAATRFSGGPSFDWARYWDYQPIIALLHSWPAVVTLRTLCIRKIHWKRVSWKGLISPMLLEYPDELEEQQAFLRRKRREST